MDMKSIELVLMRHGSTLWNEQKRYLGHTDLGLSSLGRNELVSARGKLKEMSFSSVYCSDLARCRESLKEVRSDLVMEAVYDQRLREMDFGDWEGHTYEQLKDVPLYREWLNDPQGAAPPQGESWSVFERRVDEFLQNMLQAEKQKQTLDPEKPRMALVVAHGGVIRQIVYTLVPDQAFWDTRVEPGNLLVLTLERNGDTADFQGRNLRYI
ncbi:alpha-ribazole phosphatase family protein [Paenibacillus azoreducens]|uniref:alpha-ribazole phosphatase family protein n=1 Tax=Paenibacillus azoreducens TaxID=116718 RepID=UPI0039F5FC7E